MGDEEFYDAEIAPLLKQAGEKCIARGLPCVFVVQFDKETGTHGETAWVPADAWTYMHWLRRIARSRNNFDAFVISVLREQPPGETQSMVVDLLRRKVDA